jgi:hypothetical protein
MFAVEGKRLMLGARTPPLSSWRTPARPTSGRQLAEAAAEEFGVGIEEEHVARVRRLQAAVVGVAEAVVGAGDRADPGKALLDVGSGAVVAVVDDHDVEVDVAGPLEESGQRGVEPVLAVVGDDDRADVVHVANQRPGTVQACAFAGRRRRYDAAS